MTKVPGVDPIVFRDRARAFVHAILLVGVVILGLVVRFLGIRLGLPFHHHWDEGWVVDSSADMLRHGNDVPRSYQYGAPLSRLTELAFLVLRGWRLPVAPTPWDAQVTLYFLARGVTAVIASSGIVGIYVAARFSEGSKARSRRVALASALMYTSAWELVLHSRYGVTDACLVGLTAWTLAFAAGYVATRRLRWALASVLAAGMTMAFKLPGVVTSLVPIAVLLVVRAPTLPTRVFLHRMLLLAAVPIVFGVFVLFNEHVIDHAGDAARDIVSRIKQTHDGGSSAVYLREPGLPHLASALWAISTNFLHRSFVVSAALTATAIGGLASCLRKKRTIVAVAVVHALFAVLLVALPNRVFWIRNYLVVVPCLCLGFGHGLVGLVETVRDRLVRNPHRRAFATAGIAMLAGGALVAMPLSYALSAEKMHEDPRTQAIDWIARDSPVGGAVQVGVTSGAFSKGSVGSYPGVRDLLARPNLRFAAADIDECPALAGPEYIVDASYRDTRKGEGVDPYGETWFFRDCPGYERAALFGSNPYEYDVGSLPTWLGRVSVIVLRRNDVSPARRLPP